MFEIEQIAQALKSCSETPFLDARIFCSYYQEKLTEAQIQDFIKRRQQGEPVSKIIGCKGFWKRDFVVSSDVLDPRPDSETLIEAVLRFFPDKTKSYRILDIGTGSGCLLLSLLDEYANAKGIGIDISCEALAIAQQNNVAGRAEFCRADFRDKSFYGNMGRFDIIISNPPYIPTKDIQELDKSVRCYDPLLALDGGVDGLSAYRRLSTQLAELMKQGAFVFFEIGQGQENAVIKIMQIQGFICQEKIKDLGGIIRVLVFEKAHD